MNNIKYNILNEQDYCEKREEVIQELRLYQSSKQKRDDLIQTNYDEQELKEYVKHKKNYSNNENEIEND